MVVEQETYIQSKGEQVNINGTYDILYVKDRHIERGMRPKCIAKY